MKCKIQILDKNLQQVATHEVDADKSLHSLLWHEGIPFPCGGRGRCGQCRVQILSGNLPILAKEREIFSEEQLQQGWRLACLHRIPGDLTLVLPSFSEGETILSDDLPYPFVPQEGYGIAIDVGTTTLALQLVNLQEGQVIRTVTAKNKQSTLGADVMSRIQIALHRGIDLPRDMIRQQLWQLIQKLLPYIPHPSSLKQIVLCGNTVMHHLFCGLDVTPLSHYPFQSPALGIQYFRPKLLGWDLPESAEVVFLPCLAGFVGSDILAGILACEIDTSLSPLMLIDLGTNGEIVIGQKERFFCTSTAAGPAFEAATISCGMTAEIGAIVHAAVHKGQISYEVIGDTEARGICGSGLVDVIASYLELGDIQETGRITSGESFLPLIDGLRLTQKDIRELQLAKGAIATGIRILKEHAAKAGLVPEKIFLAGAFGNYCRIPNLQKIGMFPDDPPVPIVSVGNAALRGTKIVLNGDTCIWQRVETITSTCQVVELNLDPHFTDYFAESMLFPAVHSFTDS